MVRIEIVSDMDKNIEESFDYLGKVMKGNEELKTKKRTLYMTPKIFTKVFSTQRMRLILRLKENKLENIYQLTKYLGRKYEAVHRDVKYLEGLGIIKVKKENKKRIPLIEEAIKMNEIAAQT